MGQCSCACSYSLLDKRKSPIIEAHTSKSPKINDLLNIFENERNKSTSKKQLNNNTIDATGLDSPSKETTTNSPTNYTSLDMSDDQNESDQLNNNEDNNKGVDEEDAVQVADISAENDDKFVPKFVIHLKMPEPMPTGGEKSAVSDAPADVVDEPYQEEENTEQTDNYLSLEDKLIANSLQMMTMINSLSQKTSSSKDKNETAPSSEDHTEVAPVTDSTLAQSTTDLHTASLSGEKGSSSDIPQASSIVSDSVDKDLTPDPSADTPIVISSSYSLSPPSSSSSSTVIDAKTASYDTAGSDDDEEDDRSFLLEGGLVRLRDNTPQSSKHGLQARSPRLAAVAEEEEEHEDGS